MVFGIYDAMAKDMMKVWPDWVYSRSARSKIWELSHELDEFKKHHQKLTQVKNNPAAIKNAFAAEFNDLLKAEKDGSMALNDVFIIEFRGLQIFQKFHDEFKSFLQKPIATKFPAQVKEKLSAMITKYKTAAKKLKEELYHINQDIRRKKIGREMLSDIMILIAAFLQMRIGVAQLRRAVSLIKSEEKRLMSEITKLKSMLNKSEGSAVRALNNLERDLDKFLEAVLKMSEHAIFVEKALLESRVKIDHMAEKDTEALAAAIEKGLPEQKKAFEDLLKGTSAELDRMIMSDLAKEYHQARLMTSMAMESEELPEPNVIANVVKKAA
jgi:hypothetical protein